eukprot:363351-Chlamydomonas_euryale.AAC.7
MLVDKRILTGSVGHGAVANVAAAVEKPPAFATATFTHPSRDVGTETACESVIVCGEIGGEVVHF